MSHGYGWENRPQLLKSLTASLIAGILYLMVTSFRGFSPTFVFYAILISGCGFVLSGLSESIGPDWAIVSGLLAGTVTTVASVPLSNGLTPEGFLLTLLNFPLLIIAFLAGYAGVTLVENREQLF